MKTLQLISFMIMITFLFVQCSEDLARDEPILEIDDPNAVLSDRAPSATFTVKVENVSTPHLYFASGAQAIPDGGSEAGPAFPGQSFTVQFHAGKGHKLSFAAMYGASNDLFYAPSDGGVNLFNGNNPITGDITNLISLWDAGTEVNHAPGSGIPGDDDSQPIKSVRNIDNVMDGYDYNNVEENLYATLDYDGTSLFTLTIVVLPGSSTPLAPVAWVVHFDGQKPIFTEEALDYGNGLELLAETGNPGELAAHLEMNSGYVSPVAPGVWVVHKKGQKPIFKENKPEYGNGLELLAEIGMPVEVFNSLDDEGFQTAMFNTPDGADGPGPIFPGESYTFSFEAKPGEYLSIASMLGKSNDLFFAPGQDGIRLFHGSTSINGDVTDQIYLWDAGTEVNEYPGAGINQGPGGVDEEENVMIVNDGFTWPSVLETIRITISSE